MTSSIFREATITPDAVLAGDTVEFTIRLVAGPDFSADGTRIILDLPAFLGTTRPTCHEQETNGYMAVFCSNPDIRYTKRVWDIEVTDFPTPEKTSYRGMATRFFVLDLAEGDTCYAAAEGDTIEIKWGWTRNGLGAGTQAPVLVLEPDFHNSVAVRYFTDPEGSLPDLANWNSLGTSMSEPRYLPGSAQESAVIFVIGGETTSASASTSTDYTNF